ncbi:MAG: HEAT repeat domain-containing protein [Geobacter sp.]|nr:HEAT repeat domain-containing protein [Geobacter sp.]
MTETDIVSKEDVEKPEVGKEELASAVEVMQAMLKTSKGFRMYLSNNPLLVRFIEELTAKTGAHLGRYGEYRLDVEQFDLSYRGNSIYNNRDPKESLAFKMYSDGIRSIIFCEGVEERELCDFLEIVGKDRPTDMDDDIVTLLWMKDLPNISYILAEDSLALDAAEAGTAAPASQKEGIASVYQTPPPDSAPLLVPQQILTLTDADAAWLKNAREADEKRSPLNEVINILSAILSAEKDPDEFGDFVDIVGNLTANLIHSGDLRHALNLARFMRELRKNDALPAANRERAARAMEGRFTEGVVKALKDSVDSTDAITPEELKELLLYFGAAAIVPMCELLGLVEKMKMRKALLDVLSEIGMETPEAFFPFMSDKRWYLVRNMVYVLARIRNPKALEPVARLVTHREPRVRREVLQCLERMSDPRAKTAIMRFLQDESSAIRIRAMQALAGFRVTAALKPIVAMSEGKDFEAREPAEKKAIFEALGELGGDQVVPVFRSMLMKKYWFNKEKEKESVICAVAGLRKVKTDAAIHVLEEASKVKGEETRRIVDEALRQIAAERARVAAGT